MFIEENFTEIYIYFSHYVDYMSTGFFIHLTKIPILHKILILLYTKII